MKLWSWPVTTLSPLSKKYVGCADKHMDCVQRKWVFLFFFSVKFYIYLQQSTQTHFSETVLFKANVNSCNSVKLDEIGLNLPFF